MSWAWVKSCHGRSLAHCTPNLSQCDTSFLRRDGSRGRVGLTCIKAVDKITPVPNCFPATKTRLSSDMRVNRVARIGANTPSALVARITNSRPMRSGLLYERSCRVHVGPDDESSAPPTQCLEELIQLDCGIRPRMNVVEVCVTYSTPAWKWQFRPSEAWLCSSVS